MVHSAWRDGAIHSRGALSPFALGRLRSHIRESVRPHPARSDVDGVWQTADVAVLADEVLKASPLGELAAEFGTLARREGHPLVSESFAPNEATIMSYARSTAGIGPHLDRRRYRELIAIFSVSGRARLELVADRAGRRVLTAFDCVPGDLVLLRAPGLGGIDDGRPLHQVGGPRRGTRVSLSLRMNVRSSAEEWE